MNRVTEPGIYSMSDVDYHSDPAPVPSLSRSIAKTLTEASPAHAYAQHPRLGGHPPTGPASGNDEMDIGSAAHALFLEGVNKVELIPFDTYQSKAAKEMRDAALAAGKIPLKQSKHDVTLRVVSALEQFRERTGLFTNGKPEQTVVWDEGNHWCRCRVDWLPDDTSAPLLDLKTTSGLATSSAWGRSCFGFGADVQAVLYPRGVGFARGGEEPNGLIFVVVETEPPYQIRTFGLDPVALDVGKAKCDYARKIWVDCMKTGEWPGYSNEIEYLFPPPWIVTQWTQMEFRNAR